MSTATPEVPDPSTPKGFIATARKAFIGGYTGAVMAAGTAAATIFQDGKVTSAELWTAAGLIVGGFVIGFAAVYRVPNAQ